MKKFPPLPLIDLLAYTKGHSVVCQEREREITHMARIMTRKQHNNLLIVGRRGVGKSTLVQGFAEAALTEGLSHLPPVPLLQLGTAAVSRILHNASQEEAGLQHVQAAFASLPPSILIIDDADKLLDEVDGTATFEMLFQPFITSSGHHLVLVLEEELFPKVQETYNRGFKTFDTLTLTELPRTTCEKIVHDRATRIGLAHKVQIEAAALPAIVKASDRLSSSRSQPDRSVRLLDEICAAAALQNGRRVTTELVDQVVSQRLGLPDAASQQKKNLATLHSRLAGQVIGQATATSMVADTIQRSLLGLKNPNRPMGSFLFLGPSGVGKTELAKVLAKEIYGSEKALVRVDMSEFSDAHTAARLTGAPPGYIGYEAGGQLTNPIIKQPFSLILLDEIEKAHPSIFDLFLQVFDDGRLTDGQGRTVDFTNTIIIATSNLGIRDIVAATGKGQDVSHTGFLKNTMMPILREKFRLEFLNRFEGMVVFKPLDLTDLISIARLEIKKLEKRLSSHNLSIRFSDADLEQLVADTIDPHLGARPLRRALEQRVEQAIAGQILHTPAL